MLGLLLTTQEAVKHFGPEGGSVVNISSVAATLAPPNASVYSGTKAAVNAITRSLAKELGPRKIRVNAINPGMVETEGCTPRESPRAISASKSKPKRRWAASASRKTSRRPRFSWHRRNPPGLPAKPSTSRAACGSLPILEL